MHLLPVIMCYDDEEVRAQKYDRLNTVMKELVTVEVRRLKAFAAEHLHPYLRAMDFKVEWKDLEMLTFILLTFDSKYWRAIYTKPSREERYLQLDVKLDEMTKDRKLIREQEERAR